METIYAIVRWLNSTLEVIFTTRNGDGTMTQLIGAICENGKKVITLSDRMVSTGDMTLAFEHPRMESRSHIAEIGCNDRWNGA